MIIPTRDEAIELTTMNIEQDATKFIRRIDALLMMWDGESELSLSFPEEDRYMIKYVKNLLDASGYTTRSTPTKVFFK